MKTLVLEDVTINNFMCIGNACVELQNRGFVKVTGINNFITDGAANNGAGKSSIFDAIMWAFTGQTTRGAKDVVNNKVGCDTSVRVKFLYDGHTYIIHRYKNDSKQGNNLLLIRDDFDISGKGLKDSEAVLKRELPDLDFEFLGSVAIMGQGLPLRFTNNSPAGRKQILETLSKSDFIITEVKEKLTARKSVLSSLYNEQNSKYIAHNTKLDVAKQDIVRMENQLSLLVNVDEENLLSTTKEYDCVCEDIKSTMNDISTYQQQYRDELSVTNSLRAKLAEIEKEDSVRFQTGRYELDKIVTELNVTYRHIQNEINKINSTPTHCPTCGRPYDNVHKPDVQPYLDNLSKVRQELDEACKNVTAYEKSFVYTDVKDIHSSIQESERVCSSSKYAIDSLELKLRQLQQKSSYLQKEILRLQSIKDTIEGKRQTIISSIEDNKKFCEEAEQDTIKMEQEMQDTKLRLDCISTLLTYCSRDFRGYLLTNVIDYISNQASVYSSKLFGSNKLNISLCGNGVDVVYDDKSYESLSGGERQKADICIQLAIRDMLVEFFGITCNILCLDELYDGIDSYGCEKLTDLIMSLSGISSVFIISHHTSIDIPYDSNIVVIKGDNGISTIEDSAY